MAKCPVESTATCPMNAQNSTNVSLNPSTQMPFPEDLTEGKNDLHLSQNRTVSSIPRTNPFPNTDTNTIKDCPIKKYACPLSSGVSGNSHAANDSISQPVTQCSSHVKPDNTSCQSDNIPDPSLAEVSLPPQQQQQDYQTFWMYPSAQMFYAALKRKGFHTEPRDVDAMLSVHNSLNEQVWSEILLWEKSRKGVCPEPPTLKRFRGRPQELSILARWNMLVYGADRPFDRHDWIIDRCGQDFRYVIDYYEGLPEPDGFPTMHANVRPAFDSWTSFLLRMHKKWHNP